MAIYYFVDRNPLTRRMESTWPNLGQVPPYLAKYFGSRWPTLCDPEERTTLPRPLPAPCPPPLACGSPVFRWR